jgi:hypothetical protein
MLSPCWESSRFRRWRSHILVKHRHQHIILNTVTFQNATIWIVTGAKTEVCIVYILAYFPGVARVFIYPNLIVICVPILAEIAHVDGIFSIITSTLLGGTLPTRRLIYILLHIRTNYSVEYPTVNSFIPWHQVTNDATNMHQTVT